MSDKNLFRISDFNSLIVGQHYIVELKNSCWGKAKVLYCGTCKRGTLTEYRFTFGQTVDSWVCNWNIVSVKSRLKVWGIQNA